MIYDIQDLGWFIPHTIKVKAGRTLEGQPGQPPITGSAGSAFWQPWSPTWSSNHPATEALTSVTAARPRQDQTLGCCAPPQSSFSTDFQSLPCNASPLWRCLSVINQPTPPAPLVGDTTTPAERAAGFAIPPQNFWSFKTWLLTCCLDGSLLQRQRSHGVSTGKPGPLGPLSKVQPRGSVSDPDLELTPKTRGCIPASVCSPASLGTLPAAPHLHAAQD